MPTETNSAQSAGAVDEALPLEQDGRPRTNFRWVILGLVFLAITINYVDRMVMGLLAPDLKQTFHISNQQYGYITSAFAICYALGQAASGRWLDWIGIRVGYAFSLAAWSVASMLHALPGSAVGFSVARGLLGVSESPAYPGAVKTLAEWFPKKERALAMGFVNAGANVGAVVAPIMVPWLAVNHGWQSAFLVTGGLGLLWLFLWIPLYRKPEDHPSVSAAELAYIQSDPPEPAGRVRWITLLTHPQAWAFGLGKFLTDPIWSFYLFWLPTFLRDRHHVDVQHVMAPTVTAYVMADIGSVAGGWLSSSMLKNGYSVNVARKTALLICAFCVLPAVFASSVAWLWSSVLLMGLALAAHQGFSSNLYTLVSDTFPKRAVGSVSGLGGTFGYVGTALFNILTGWILDHNGKNYLPIFIICGTSYLLAYLLIHVLMPRLEPAYIRDDDAPRGLDGMPPR